MTSNSDNIQFEWSDVCFFEEDQPEGKQKEKVSIETCMESMYPTGRFLIHSSGCFGIISENDIVFFGDKIIGKIHFDNECGYYIEGDQGVKFLEEKKFYSFESLVKSLNVPFSSIDKICVKTKDENDPCISIDSIQKKILHYITVYPVLIKGLKKVKEVVDHLSKGDLHSKLANEIGIIESITI